MTFSSPPRAPLCARSGGLELLFGNVKHFTAVNISSADSGGGEVTMAVALAWMKAHMLRERPELFLSNETMCVARRTTLNYNTKLCAPCSWRSLVAPNHFRGALHTYTQLHRVLLRSRPGILVLINDCDWELEDQLHYRLKDGDNLAFISTLHGG